MTNETRISEIRTTHSGVRALPLAFGFQHSFVIRHSDFVLHYPSARLVLEISAVNGNLLACRTFPKGKRRRLSCSESAWILTATNASRPARISPWWAGARKRTKK